MQTIVRRAPDGCQDGAGGSIVSAPRPLDGVRIVELADIVAGPSVGAFLGDFGAEIVKIERLEGGDAARRMGGMLDDRSAWWAVLGRNKRSVALNLKSEQGREAFLRLLDAADALVEAYRPGVLEDLGLAPDVAARRETARLVVVRISGFGQSGPRSTFPGWARWPRRTRGSPASPARPTGLRCCRPSRSATSRPGCSRPGRCWPRSTGATPAVAPGR